MPQICCQADAYGRYAMDLAVGNLELQVFIDSGLTDPFHRLGLELEPTVFDQLLRTGHLIAGPPRKRRDANGRFLAASTGQTSARLLDPISRQRVGPYVQLDAFRGAVGLSHRVGVVFFHRLTGCRVLWDLDSRARCVEIP
jgi:hypothetical protein